MTDKTDYSTRRFLIVDDESFMLSLLERILKQLRVGGIVKSPDGAEALKVIKDDLSQVDCIISDFNMKPVNGLQLLQAVRAGVNPRIPRDQAFIMLTGHGESEVVKTAIMLDVNGYLVKPVAPDKLIQNLDRVFKKPIEVKSADYYRKINLNSTAPMNDADAKGPKSWVMLPKAGPFRDSEALRNKIKEFRVENATRDGVDEEVKIKNRRQCDLSELRDGMLLAEDVEAEEGTILLRKGTHLTARMVARLRELAVETQSRNHIWIGDPG